MKTVKVKLQSVSPLSFGKMYKCDKLDKESPAAFEERTWKNRCHTDSKGFLILPPNMIKNTIAATAKYLSMGIPGKGKATYTKHFEAGVLVSDIAFLANEGKNIHIDTVKGEWMFVPSDGRRGGTTRVEKCFPFIPEWQSEILVYILDETITPDVLKYHIEESGKFIGFGRFRPRNNGYYGRFEVVDFKIV